jgi:signal transduction histidine kinase/ligand-binding sensor domain-containing protein
MEMIAAVLRESGDRVYGPSGAAAKLCIRGFISRTVMFCVLSAVAANASDRLPAMFQPASDYVSTQFTVDDGLPTNEVDSIVQSPDGFLWVAAGSLSRFDGRHFMALDPVRDRVPALALSSEGDLWVVSSAHELERIPAAVLPLGNLSGIRYRTGLGPENVINCLHPSRDGVLWAGTDVGLYRLEGDLLKLIVPKIAVFRIEEARDGHLLLQTDQGFMEWDGARIIRHPEVAAQLGLKAPEIYHVFEDSHGITWFCTANGVARRAGGSVEKLKPWRRGNAIYHVSEDHRGNVWFGGVEGMFRAGASNLEQVIAKLEVRYIYGDRDGNVWVGTNGQGLIRLRERAIQMFTTEDGLPSNVAQTVLAGHDGALWTGFNCGGLSWFDGNSFHTYKEKDGLLNTCVWSLAEDANHDLWIGTWGGGAFRFHNGSFQQYSKTQGLAGNQVLSVLSARDGSMWIATLSGLSRLWEGHFRTYTREDGLSSNTVISLREDHTGTIWVGTTAGVDRLVGDRFVNVSLTHTSTLILGEDRGGSFYWSPSTGGIFHLENSTPVKALAKFWVSDLNKGEHDDIWLVASGGTNTKSGIFRLPPSGLRRVPGRDEPIDYAVFGSADGFGAGEGSSGTPASAITRDGKLWFATTAGLARLDVSRISANDQRPSIYVKEIMVGRNQQPADRQLRLPAGTRHLEISFDAIEISEPEKIRLQYRMDGVDTEWLDATPPGHAIYTNIPPGTHAFRVRATNAAGIWDYAGIAYPVTQLPYFYETAWFRALSVMAFLAMIGVAYQFRLGQLRRQFNMALDARVNERTRIARDLHDTLLQSFQGVMMKFHAVTYMLTDRPDAKRNLDAVIEQAREAIIEGRDAVQGLRSSTLVGNDLAKAISVLAEDLAAHHINQSPPQFCLQVEGETRELVPLIRDEVYRVASEALRNAFRHSQAEKIEVEIHYNPKQFRLRVRDNGKGIGTSVLTGVVLSGHYGLPGMQERAKLIGGQLNVWSELDSGTEIELTIPASLAYHQSPVKRRFVFWRTGV